METYNERSLCLKYRSQGVQTSFYESTPFTPNPLGDQIPPGARGNSRHAGTDHPHASEKRNNRGASEFPRILLKRIPGTQSFRRVASSYRFKKSERPHSCTFMHFRMFTTNSVLSSIRKGDYAFKIDLQDAYFHVPIHPSSRKYLRFAFENKVYQFRVLPFGLNTDFYSFGHKVTGYLHRLVIPYLDEWLIHHPDRQVLHSTSGPAYKYTGPSRLYPKQKEIRAGPGSGSPVSQYSLTPESKAWEIVAHARHLSSLRVLTYQQVSQLMGSLNWASSLIPLSRLYLRPLQRHFHSLGLTDRFTPLRRSDPLVLANLLRHWQDLHFLTSGIPIRTFQADFRIFTDASTQGKIRQ